VKWPSRDDALLNIVEHLRRRLQGARVKETLSSAGDRATPTIVPVARSSNLALPREFNDQERLDFAESTFEYVRSYFDRSLQELISRNAGITAKMRSKSDQGFIVVVFRGGKRVAGCYVRLSGLMRSHGIAYSGGEDSSENSYNELLSVEADKQGLFMRPTMAMLHGNANANLSQEGAAEHLWTMLISPLQ